MLPAALLALGAFCNAMRLTVRGLPEGARHCRCPLAAGDLCPGTVGFMSVEVIGKPAAFAQTLAWKARGRAFACLGGVLACAVGAWLLLGSVLVWVFVLAGFTCAFAASKWFSDAAKAQVGVNAEKAVVDLLRRSGRPAVVLNGLMLGAGGDADHVVLGPMAMVIETKAGFAALSVRDGKVYSGSRSVGSDPVGQVLRQASALSRVLGVPVQPVVCIPGASGGVYKVGQVVVCTGKSLSKVLASAPSVLPVSTLPRALEVLKRVDAKNQK